MCVCVYISKCQVKQMCIAPIFSVHTCSVNETGLTSNAGLGIFDKCLISKRVIVVKKMITRLVVISIPLTKWKNTMHNDRTWFDRQHNYASLFCGNASFFFLNNLFTKQSNLYRFLITPCEHCLKIEKFHHLSVT